MTLNTVSVMDLLTLSVFGVPMLGAASDKYNAELVKIETPAIYENQKKNEKFFSWSFEKVDIKAVEKDLNLSEGSVEKKEFDNKVEDNQRRELKFAAFFPALLGIIYIHCSIL